MNKINLEETLEVKDLSYELVYDDANDKNLTAQLL